MLFWRYNTSNSALWIIHVPFPSWNHMNMAMKYRLSCNLSSICSYIKTLYWFIFFYYFFFFTSWPAAPPPFFLLYNISIICYNMFLICLNMFKICLNKKLISCLIIFFSLRPWCTDNLNKTRYYPPKKTIVYYQS